MDVTSKAADEASASEQTAVSQTEATPPCAEEGVAEEEEEEEGDAAEVQSWWLFIYLYIWHVENQSCASFFLSILKRCISSQQWHQFSWTGSSLISFLVFIFSVTRVHIVYFHQKWQNSSVLFLIRIRKKSSLLLMKEKDVR